MGFSAARTVALILAVGWSLSIDGQARASTTGPFAAIAGWWGGEGRLRFKDGKQEQVKCRTTYFVSGEGDELKQTIRCASGSGKIEVTSQVKHEGGKLTGTWVETVYDLNGELTGEVTPRGYRVSIKGSDSTPYANMEIIVRDKKQIIEIQFFNETLVGLTLLLNKGEAVSQ
jgi:hypothetical protein